MKRPPIRLRSRISYSEDWTSEFCKYPRREIAMAADLTGLSDEAQRLARVPLFKRLEPHELEHLAEEIDQVNYKAGETIFHEHDRGDALYVLEEGSVRIWVTDEDLQEVTLAELQPGAFFGELAVLDRGERSSSATAITDVHLPRSSRHDFQQLFTEHSAV